MLLLMPCGFHLAETVDEWARHAAPAGTAELAAVRRGQVFALDGSAYFSRPGPRVIDGIELLAEIFDPGRLRRGRSARVLDAGRGLSRAPRCRSARPSTACGAARRTPAAAPDDLEGWAQLCPDCVGKAGDNGFLRFRLHQALTERAAAGGGTAASTAAELAGARTAATATAPAAVRRRPRRRAARLLRGAGRRVRRLVPAPRPLRARARPRRGLERRARCRRPLARRPADPRRDRGARRRDRLVVAAPRGEGRAVAVRRAPAPRSSGRASGWSPMACGPTSTCATPGPSRIGTVDAVFTGFWLSHVPRDRLAAFLGSSGAGSSPAAPSPSSIRGPTRSRAPPTIRPRPTTSRSAASTTAASSRSSRSTTSRRSSRPRCSTPGSSRPSVTTTGRFFLTGTARAGGTGTRLTGAPGRRPEAPHGPGTAPAPGYTPRRCPPWRSPRSRPSAPA